jgi:4-hydroxyproline epimerase
MSDLTWPERIRVIDSHTEGEPTRVVIEGWELSSRTMADRRLEVAEKWDHLRSAVVCEPRGHDAMVGALLTPPENEGSVAGVVFFNNVGPLWMCGHGMIGTIRTLEDMGRIQPGTVRVDTPVGTVTARLEDDGSVVIGNVNSWCHARDVAVDVPGFGTVTGDIAWGGNWFFIAHIEEPTLDLSNVDELLRVTRLILASLKEQGITGKDGEEIDHVELFSHGFSDTADARNFVLCPGGAYDRSPCGTGTSAKLAVLHARGELGVGEKFRQESVTGGMFTGWLEQEGDNLRPYVRGRAWITGESVQRFDATDPFRAGFTTAG